MVKVSSSLSRGSVRAPQLGDGDHAQKGRARLRFGHPSHYAVIGMRLGESEIKLVSRR